jgi:hypothetical protein
MDSVRPAAERYVECVKWLAAHQLTRDELLACKLTRFTIVRHPFDRLVSCWADKVRGTGILMPKDTSFARFVSRLNDDYVTGNRHVAPATRVLYHETTGELMVDRILRFEHLEEDWELIREEFGLQKLQRVNTSKRGAAPMDYYTPEIVEAVAAYYQDDMKNFGYNMDGTHTATIPCLEG